MQDEPIAEPLRFRAGTLGAVAPLGVFLAGVTALGLAGAPDERGLWPVLLAAIAVGMALARDRGRYGVALIDGMSRPIVMLMVVAWLLAGVFGAVLSTGGLVDALAGVARSAALTGGGYAGAAFLVCCVLASATGTSFGTMIIAFPLLYPAGAGAGADPVILAGAMIGGATFGDNVSPVSDTTIASATTQGAEIGAVVASRLRYALPAAAVALTGTVIAGSAGAGGGSSAVGAMGATPLEAAGAATQAMNTTGSAAALVLLAAPAIVILLLWRGRHLVEGLLAGIVVGLALGLVAGVLQPADVVRIDADAFTTRGLVVDGMTRGIGISVFTILLMGVVGTIEASGLLDRVVSAAAARARSARGAEGWIFAAVSAATLLTTHSVVAILAVGRFAAETGARFGIDPRRRANLLDTTVCTYPFLLPWFVPTILAASLTASGADAGMPRLSALQVGFANLHSWTLLAIVLLAVFRGYGRDGP